MKFTLSVLLLILLTAFRYQHVLPEAHLASADTTLFPRELVEFGKDDRNPLFNGTGTDTWDKKIRERGWILKEGNQYHLWYTGYRESEDEEKHLGYATSPDGIHWTRYPGNPIYAAGWVEDMCVVKSGATYYMFAEGREDVAHLLTSTDRIHWTEHGPLDIRYTNGTPLTKGAYGTPTVWLEKGVWYLFYERGDLGIWLATSTDHTVWKNVQDEPVLKRGPEAYDREGFAMDQVIRYQGKYYAYYHATSVPEWNDWTTNAAVSSDLVHWEKFAGNPILKDNRGSAILVNDGTQYRMYSMHPGVYVHWPLKK